MIRDVSASTSSERRNNASSFSRPNASVSLPSQSVTHGCCSGGRSLKPPERSLRIGTSSVSGSPETTTPQAWMPAPSTAFSTVRAWPRIRAAIGSDSTTVRNPSPAAKSGFSSSANPAGLPWLTGTSAAILLPRSLRP